MKKQQRSPLTQTHQHDSSQQQQTTTYRMHGLQKQHLYFHYHSIKSIYEMKTRCMKTFKLSNNQTWGVVSTKAAGTHFLTVCSETLKPSTVCDEYEKTVIRGVWFHPQARRCGGEQLCREVQYFNASEITAHYLSSCLGSGEKKNSWHIYLPAPPLSCTHSCNHHPRSFWSNFLFFFPLLPLPFLLKLISACLVWQ